MGSNFVRIIERYAKQLDIAGNKLIPAGIKHRIMEQLKRTTRRCSRLDFSKRGSRILMKSHEAGFVVQTL